jgi:hypothetical protein
MSQESINAESPLEDQLVAYLDGELDAESCRRIEEQLAVDPDVRRKLHDLEQTWELLDDLDSTPVGEQFTRTTLEMVALAAEEDVRKGAEEAPRRRRRLWFLTGGGMLAAGLAGFMAFSLLAANPNRELNKKLRQDLPILVNLDEYRVIQDIDFLRLIEKSGLFPKAKSKEQTTVAARAGKTNAKGDLVQYIQSLTPEDKDVLLRKQDRFAALSQDEKAGLEKLHEQIQEDKKNADELRAVMNRYYEWYRTLPSYSRPESNLSAEKRLAWVKKELTEITSRPPTSTDSDALWRWMEKYTKNHEAEILKNLPEWPRRNLSDMSASARRWGVMLMIWSRPQGGQNKDSVFSESDIAELLEELTPKTQELLEAKTPAERIRIIQNWTHYLFRQKNQWRGPVDDVQLAEFFEKDLNEEERDRLMILPSDEMQQQLQRLYIAKNRPLTNFPRGRDGFGPGPPPGDGFAPNQPPLEKTENSKNPTGKR